MQEASGRYHTAHPVLTLGESVDAVFENCLVAVEGQRVTVKPDSFWQGPEAARRVLNMRLYSARLQSTYTNIGKNRMLNTEDISITLLYPEFPMPWREIS